MKNYSLLIFHLKQSGFFQNSSRSLQSDLGFYYSSKYAWKVSFVWMAHPHFGQLTSQILPEVFETTEGLLKRFDRSSSFKDIFSLHPGHSIINIFITTFPVLSERIYDAPWLGSLCDGTFWGDNSTTQRCRRAIKRHSAHAIRKPKSNLAARSRRCFGLADERGGCFLFLLPPSGCFVFRTAGAAFSLRVT